MLLAQMCSVVCTLHTLGDSALVRTQYMGHRLLLSGPSSLPAQSTEKRLKQKQSNTENAIGIVSMELPGRLLFMWTTSYHGFVQGLLGSWPVWGFVCCLAALRGFVGLADPFTVYKPCVSAQSCALLMLLVCSGFALLQRRHVCTWHAACSRSRQARHGCVAAARRLTAKPTLTGGRGYSMWQAGSTKCLHLRWLRSGCGTWGAPNPWGLRMEVLDARLLSHCLNTVSFLLA